jgi:hypothetical protein
MVTARLAQASTCHYLEMGGAEKIKKNDKKEEKRKSEKILFPSLLAASIIF